MLLNEYWCKNKTFQNTFQNAFHKHFSMAGVTIRKMAISLKTYISRTIADMMIKSAFWSTLEIDLSVSRPFYQCYPALPTE